MSTEPNNQVLALLAKEWDMAALKDLYARGLIDMNKLKTSAFLSPEGYDAVEREGERGGHQSHTVKTP